MASTKKRLEGRAALPDAKARPLFDLLAGGDDVAKACRALGVKPGSIYRRMLTDEQFVEDLREACAPKVFQVLEAAFKAATTPDAQGRYQIAAITFVLSNLAPQLFQLKPDGRRRGAAAAEGAPPKNLPELPAETQRQITTLVHDALLGKRSAPAPVEVPVVAEEPAPDDGTPVH